MILLVVLNGTKQDNFAYNIKLSDSLQQVWIESAAMIELPNIHMCHQQTW